MSAQKILCRVGKAERAHQCFVSWWARRSRSFAHPTCFLHYDYTKICVAFFEAHMRLPCQ